MKAPGDEHSSLIHRLTSPRTGVLLGCFALGVGIWATLSESALGETVPAEAAAAMDESIQTVTNWDDLADRASRSSVSLPPLRSFSSPQVPQDWQQQGTVPHKGTAVAFGSARRQSNDSSARLMDRLRATRKPPPGALRLRRAQK